MIPLTLGAYKIPIDGSALTPTVASWLKEINSPDSLQAALGWDSVPETLNLGIAPAKNTAELQKHFTAHRKRLALEKARLAAGFPDLIGPRTGIKGLLQKWFRDPKEPRLPIEIDILEWIEACPRYQLLVALHDSLLNRTAVAEPQPVTLEDIGRFSHPIADLLASGDPKRLQKFCNLLTAPFKKIDPNTILNDVAGYVVAFDTRSGFAYYFG
ncbi:MAG: hypothetical protein OHK005_01130 [Candidatus Methylacidiphilales bacterium]